MQDIQLLLEQYGSWLVFANVLVEQVGLPVPAYPMLVAAGALAGAPGWLTPWLAAIVACLLADSLWYAAGRRYGSRFLSVICKVSLSQNSCIRQTQRLYLRIGVRALLVCKFLPGAGALSTVMAGLTGTPYRRFLVYDLAGAMPTPGPCAAATMPGRGTRIRLEPSIGTWIAMDSSCPWVPEDDPAK